MPSPTTRAAAGTRSRTDPRYAWAVVTLIERLTARVYSHDDSDVRDVLRDDSVTAGIDLACVDAAVDTALAGYSDARVHGYIGVLVEREVRSTLGLFGGTEAE